MIYQLEAVFILFFIFFFSNCNVDGWGTVDGGAGGYLKKAMTALPVLVFDLVLED